MHPNGRSTRTRPLPYRILGRRASRAEVMVPAKGHQSQFNVLLCRRCKAPSHGEVKPLLKPSTKALVTRPSFVVVSTKQRPKGPFAVESCGLVEPRQAGRSCNQATRFCPSDSSAALVGLAM